MPWERLRRPPIESQRRAPRGCRAHAHCAGSEADRSNTSSESDSSRHRLHLSATSLAKALQLLHQHGHAAQTRPPQPRPAQHRAQQPRSALEEKSTAPTGATHPTAGNATVAASGAGAQYEQKH